MYALITQPEKVVDLRIVQKVEKNYSIAYIDFETEGDLTDALKIDRMNIEGRCIYAAKSKPPEKAQDQFTLFLNNLPFGLKDEELKKALEFCKSDIEEMRLKKSYAFVKFKTEAAMKKHHKVLKNFRIKGRRIVAKVAGKEKEEGSIKGSESHREKIEEEEDSEDHSQLVTGLEGQIRGSNGDQKSRAKPVESLGKREDCVKMEIEMEGGLKAKEEPKPVITEEAKTGVRGRGRNNEDFRKMMGLNK